MARDTFSAIVIVLTGLILINSAYAQSEEENAAAITRQCEKKRNNLEDACEFFGKTSNICKLKREAYEKSCGYHPASPADEIERLVEDYMVALNECTQEELKNLNTQASADIAVAQSCKTKYGLFIAKMIVDKSSLMFFENGDSAMVPVSLVVMSGDYDSPTQSVFTSIVTASKDDDGKWKLEGPLLPQAGQ